MKVSRSLTLVATVLALALGSAPASAASGAPVTVPMHKYFKYCGFNVRIDRVDAYPAIDPTNKVLKAAVAGNYQHGDAKGFIVVHGRVQNPTGSSQTFPNYTNLLFELKDGEQYQEPLAPIYHDPSGVQIPPTASSIDVMPKEAMNVAWVAANWNGVPPTKFFFQDNGSCQPGQVSFTRIIFGKHDVKVHAP